MSKKKIIFIGLGLFLLSSLFIIGYTVFFSNGSSNDVGFTLELERDKLNIEGLEFDIKEAGYIKGKKEFMNELELYKTYNDYVVLNLTIQNTLEEKLYLDGISLFNANDEMIGEAIYVYIDEQLSYSMDRDLVEENKMMINGPEFEGKEYREGLIYILTDEIKGETLYLDIMVNNEIGRVKVNKTKEKFELNDLEDIVVFKEDGLEKTEIGNLKEGLVLDTEKFNLDADELEIEVLGSQYFTDIPEDFLDNISHLTSVTGFESMLMLDVNIKNISSEDNHINKFNLYKGDREGIDGLFESLTIVGSEDFGNGVVSKDFLSEYKLLDFKGVGSEREKFSSKEETNGKIIFIGDNLDDKSLYFIEYSGLDDNSDKIEFRIK